MKKTYIGLLFCIVVSVYSKASEDTSILIISILGFNLEEHEIDNIVYSLHGNTATFHKGKIGRWEKYFTPKHKKQFKETAGQLLIDLGYEDDFNW